MYTMNEVAQEMRRMMKSVRRSNSYEKSMFMEHPIDFERNPLLDGIVYAFFDTTYDFSMMTEEYLIKNRPPTWRLLKLGMTRRIARKAIPSAYVRMGLVQNYCSRYYKKYYAEIVKDWINGKDNSGDN